VALVDMVAGCEEGDALMLACRPKNATTLTFAAWALREDVLSPTDEGDGGADINGARWWRNSQSYWSGSLGVARAGDGFEGAQYGCWPRENEVTPMLCWQLEGAQMVGASLGRCGLQSATFTWERVLLQATVRDSASAEYAYPTATPTASSTPTGPSTSTPSASLSLCATPSATPTPSGELYTPWGPQADVPISALLGWRQCYAAPLWERQASVMEVVRACAGPSLLMACRSPQNDTLRLLAWAPREDVLFDLGSDDPFALHASNGVAWYFQPRVSWGFAADDGAGVYHQGCDWLDASYRSRMSLWMSDVGSVGSCRCGSASYDADGRFEALWFTADVAFPRSSPPSTPSSTASPSLSPTASPTALPTCSQTASLASGASPSGSPTPTPAFYAPYGPVVDVPESALTGWAQCHASGFNTTQNLSTVLDACAGPSLMLACRQAGNDTLSLLAWALREDATWDAGSLVTASRRANGAEWYFS
jgi:hypothetical protein